MTAIHGSAARLLANGLAIHRFLRELTISADRDVHDKTTFGQTAHRFQAGLKDATLSGGGFFDPGEDDGGGGATLAADEALDAALGGADSVLTYMPAGDGFGVACAGLIGSQTEYEVTSPVEELEDVGFAVQSNVGKERLVTLHPEGAAAGNGLGLDAGASSPDGGVAYLQVTAIDAGTTATIAVQDSADDITYVDLITFDEVTATGAQRAEVEGTVERYVRASSVVAPGSATHHVAFGRR